MRLIHSERSQKSNMTSRIYRYSKSNKSNVNSIFTFIPVFVNLDVRRNEQNFPISVLTRI